MAKFDSFLDGIFWIEARSDAELFQSTKLKSIATQAEIDINPYP